VVLYDNYYAVVGGSDCIDGVGNHSYEIVGKAGTVGASGENAVDDLRRLMNNRWNEPLLC
jgi:hypothetical protein